MRRQERRSDQQLRVGAPAAGTDGAFTWRASEIDSVLHVRFIGDLDATVASIVVDGLKEPLEGWRRTVVVHLGEVTFIDSSGLGIVLGIRRRLADRDGMLFISEPSPCVKRIVDLCGVATYLTPIDMDEVETRACGGCGATLSSIARACGSCGNPV